MSGTSQQLRGRVEKPWHGSRLGLRPPGRYFPALSFATLPQEHDTMSLTENLEELERRNQAAELGGGEDRIAKQHEAGKMTARERIDVLLDRGSFVELDKFKTHRC